MANELKADLHSHPSGGHTMADQDGLPPIWGEGWNPTVSLEFEQPLKVADVRQKMMLEVAQQSDGHLRVFAFIWDEMTSEIEEWDGEEFHIFSNDLVSAIQDNLGRSCAND